MLAKAQEYMADESVSILARELALRAGQSAGVSRHTMQSEEGREGGREEGREGWGL
jgi:hypothetical protein